MSDRERAVVIFDADGKYVLYTSPHCRITDNPGGALTITDLALYGPPEWVRRAEANGEIAKRELADEAPGVWTGIKRTERDLGGDFLGGVLDEPSTP